MEPKLIQSQLLDDSSKIEDGETEIAIGNPLGFEGSVTQEIISGKKRKIPLSLNGNKHPNWQAQIIQTDAAINPGNSGGALLIKTVNLLVLILVKSHNKQLKVLVLQLT